jgi:hypothetical protein
LVPRTTLRPFAVSWGLLSTSFLLQSKRYPSFTHTTKNLKEWTCLCATD